MRRVNSKKFILITLAVPLLVVVFFAVTVFITASTFGDDDFRPSAVTVAVVDETGVLSQRLTPLGDEYTIFVEADSGEVESDVLNGDYDGYVLLPSGMIDDPAVRPQYFTTEGGGRNIENILESRIRRTLEDYLLDPDARDILNRDVSVEVVTLIDEGAEAESTLEESGSTVGYSISGTFMGMLMYIFVLTYGTVVMYAAIEEKSSRVVEVIISSVRPFDLLLGKVLGIGGMGLLQMFLWGLMVLIGVTFVDPSMYNLSDTASNEEIMAVLEIGLPNLSPALFIWFILFFLAGYLLYASLFAVVGILIESPQDAQGLMLPVLLPILLSIFTLGPVARDPQSTLAVVLSLIPLTSPITTTVRLAVDALPWWELLLSYSLLIAGFLGSLWLSARIYRMGLLMYGKKGTFKDIVRWLRYS